MEPHFESGAGLGWAGLGWAGRAGLGWAGLWRLGWLAGLGGGWAADCAGLGAGLGWGSPETEIGLFENGNVVSRPKI